MFVNFSPAWKTFCNVEKYVWKKLFIKHFFSVYHIKLYAEKYNK